MSTMTTLSQLHQEVAQLEARASAAEARATAAEAKAEELQKARVVWQQHCADAANKYADERDAARKELARYQRADVGERVRGHERLHAEMESASKRMRLPDTLAVTHESRGELLAIARQQQAEIERLHSENEALARKESQAAQDLGNLQLVASMQEARLRSFEEADTKPTPKISASAVSGESVCSFCGATQEQVAKMCRGNDAHICGECVALCIDVMQLADTSPPTPKVGPELSGPAEELPAQEEAYRPGLPPEALRKAWPEWEDSQGDRLRFTEDGERFGFLTLSGAAIESESTYIAEDSNGGQFAVCKHRPHGATWFEVEQRAARLLGQAGAKAGRDRMSLERLWTVIGAPDHDGKVAYAAYHAGYDGAIEYRDACNGGLLGGERYRVFQELGCEWEYTPKYEAWRPTLNGKPIPWSRVGG